MAALCVGLLTLVSPRRLRRRPIAQAIPTPSARRARIVVDPRAHPIIGTMQYDKTLPLEDREVVLTFDDGPLPKYI